MKLIITAFLFVFQNVVKVGKVFAADQYDASCFKSRRR